mgnify:CR=1 FL=1
MPACIGIDGCPAGWVAAHALGVTVAERLADLLGKLGVVAGRDIVAIDMPIGLMDTGTRACDHAARAALGAGRRNSVFWTATRAAVWAETGELSLREGHARANEINRHHGAGGVSAQAYNLFPKIREVETLLLDQPTLQASVYEVHPELAFAAWQAQTRGLAPDSVLPMAHAKKSGLGAYDRLSLIVARYGRQGLETTRAAHRQAAVADDDIADAYAARYSAERIAAGRHVTLPDPPPLDAAGLPVRICY